MRKSETVRLMEFFFLKGLGKFLVLLVPIVLAWLTSPLIFGSFSLILMIAYFLNIVFFKAHNTPFVVSSREEIKESGEIFSSVNVHFSYLIFSSIMGLAIFYFFKSYILGFSGMSEETYIFVYFFFMGINIQSYISSFFLASNKVKKNSSYDFSSGILTFFSFITLAQVFDFSILSSGFLAYFFGSIFPIFFYKNITFFSKKGKEFFPIFKKNFTFYLWQVIGLSSVYFINWGDNVILRMYTSIDQIGIYNFAYQFFKAGTIGLFFVSDFFLPSASDRSFDTTWLSRYKRNIKKYFFLGLIAIVLLGISFFFFTYFFMSSEYFLAIPVGIILFIGLIPHIVSVFYIPVLNARKRFKAIQLIFIFQISVNLLMDIVLVPVFGIVGAALGTLIGYLTGTVFFFKLFKKEISS